jgi:hypothetical protein
MVAAKLCVCQRPTVLIAMRSLNEVFIRRDPKTGDVILSRKPGTWDDFFDLLKTVEIPNE